MVVIIIIEARVVETIYVPTNSIVSRIPAVIAEILVIWMPVHKPDSSETVHRVHPKRTTMKVTGETPVEVILIVITSGVSPRHGAPPAKRLRPSARVETFAVVAILVGTVAIVLVIVAVVKPVHVLSSEASSSKVSVAALSVVAVAAEALVVETFVIVATERPRPASAAEALAVR